MKTTDNAGYHERLSEDMVQRVLVNLRYNTPYLRDELATKLDSEGL